MRRRARCPIVVRGIFDKEEESVVKDGASES